HPPASISLYPLSLHDTLPFFSFCFSLFIPVRFSTHIFLKQDPSFSIYFFLILTLILALHTSSFLNTFIFKAKALTSTLIFPHSPDRKSTRLNSSHLKISYAVF